MNAPTPPGWYPDNLGNGQRYWDGQRWTDHTAPPPPGFQPTAGQPAAGVPIYDPTRSAHPGIAPMEGPQNWFMRHKVLSGVLAFVLLIGIVGAIGGAAEDPVPAASDTSGTSDDVIDADNANAVSEPAPEPEPVDTDGDGTADDVDFAPDDAKIQSATDVDTDRDGVSDPEDLQPKNAKVQTEDDIDTDGDKVPDYQDAFPEDAAYSKDSDDDSVADQLDAFPQDAKYSVDTDGDRVADSVDAFPSDSSRSKITLAMENALGSAQDYLDYSAFSRQGLIDQLTSDYGAGFELEDATWAVDNLNANWSKQAVRSAKEYLDYSSFSRQGLIDQLSSAYGAQFTVEQATYAVDKIGL